MAAQLRPGLSITEVRNLRRLSQGDLEKRLGLSKGYIGKIDGKKVQTTADRLQQIASALDVEPTYFSYLLDPDAAQPRTLVTEVIDCLLRTEPLPRRAPKNERGLSRDPKAQIVECQEPIELADALEDLFSREAQHRKSGAITVLWAAGTYASEGEVSKRFYEQAVPRLIYSGGRLCHILRSSNDPNQLIPTVLSMVETAKRYSSFKTYECRLSPHIGVSIIPTDLYIAAHAGAISAYCKVLNIEPSRGVYLTRKVGVLSDYVRVLETTAERVVRYFSSKEDEAAHQEYNAQAEIFQGSRYIVQRRFADATRPASDFEEGTGWWDRNSRRPQLVAQLDMEEFTRRRRAANAAFHKRVRHYPVRQVACWNTLERWAQSGYRSDLPLLGGPEMVQRESKKEIIDRLENIHSLLANPLYELALVDEPTFQAIVGHPGTPKCELGWVLNGKDAVVVELTESVGEKHGDIYRVAIEERVIAQEFASIFEKHWGRLPSDTKNKEVVSKRLLQLQALATGG